MIISARSRFDWIMKYLGNWKSNISGVIARVISEVSVWVSPVGESVHVVDDIPKWPVAQRIPHKMCICFSCHRSLLDDLVNRNLG